MKYLTKNHGHSKHKTHKGTQTHTQYALRGLNVTIERGEKVAVIGRTGAGKSSLCLSISKAYPCEKGRIFLDFQDISSKSTRWVRSKIAFVPQSPIFFGGSLLQNIFPGELGDVGGFSYEVRAWKVLEQLGLAQTVRNLPRGLNTSISDGQKLLSAGEKQLLCVARALVKESGLICCDEPTANVDKDTSTTIHNVLLASKHNTLLIVCHGLDHIERFDRVLVMERGKVIENGNPLELLKNGSSSQLSALVKEDRKIRLDKGSLRTSSVSKADVIEARPKAGGDDCKQQ